MKVIKDLSRFIGGISEFARESPIQDSHAFSRAIDFRTDPQNLILLPKAIKESGTVVTDLIKWGEIYSPTLISYFYGNTGNIYSRTLAGSYTFLRQVAVSGGNGLIYSAEDDYLYYASNKTIGRYGPLVTSPSFTDDYFGSQGGVPLNTNSLTLASASSQYADRVDTASLSVTGNLSISAQIKPTTLPTSGNSMVLVSKWTVQGNARSYMLDIGAVSGYFGDGSDGALTISSDTTEAPIDSACTGTTGTTTLSATNASFASGQIIFIHQTQGAGAGAWQRNSIVSYSAGTITLGTVLNTTYGTGAQVRVMKQYTNVTVNNGIFYTAKAWNGTVGGILAFIANGTVTIAGSITANGKGYRGGAGANGTQGTQGEGQVALGGASTASNNFGGGGGSGDSGNRASGGGGGGYGTGGTTAANAGSSTGGVGGDAGGAADLTTLVFGGGGGGGARGSGVTGTGGTGGAGGGGVFITGTTITITGSITCLGNNGGGGSGEGSGGGAGAGGSILLKGQTVTLGAALVTATGGAGGAAATTNETAGGAAGIGRNHLDYYTSYTGTTSPTLDVLLDNNLVTNTTYQLRLSLSSTGTNSETLSQAAMLSTGIWQQVGVAWTASTSTAIFYLNGVAIGTIVGAFTAISDNASRFGIGKSIDGAGANVNFYNGLIDEVQVYNNIQTASNFLAALTQQVSTTVTGLQAYYKLNNDYTDATANANDLTASGAPVFTTDVPFPSPTTRLDIDQSATTTGNTYTTPAAISESATNRLTFTPAKDPQKSLAVLVAAKGTGAWTITVHDLSNNVIATSTITNANMTTGYVEFTFSSLWRPLTNFTNVYHFHVTSTVADGTVTTTTVSDLTTVSYRTYYQFLVTDVNWHPMTKFLNFWVVGNEKWIGKYEATLYEPNKVNIGADWRIRCFAKWGEYLVIGVIKNTTNIYDTDVGRIYFWDGYSPTYNYSVEIFGGGVNAMLGVSDKLYIWAGYRNQMLEYTGGLTARKTRRLPKLETTKYSEVYPQAVTMWQSLLRFAPSGSSNSATFQRGVYTYGASSIRYQDVLSYDYIPSTGNNLSTVSIGLIMVVNNKLLLGWQDGTAYGVDYVDPATTTYGQGTIEFLINSNEKYYKEKDALNIKAVFAALVSGDSFSLKYKINDSAAWSALTTTTTVGTKSLILSLPSSRYNEFQIACDFSTTNTLSPALSSISLEIDDLEQEKTL